MEHPVLYLARVTKFLDGIIEEHGHYMFMGFVFLCIAFLIWMLTRRPHRPGPGDGILS